MMTPRSRTFTGAALMLVLIPIFAGLLACMPVPIGNPERSRIDPDMTGVWALTLPDDADVDPGFYVFEPYDKRTWLVTVIGLEEGVETDLDDYDFSSIAGYEELASHEKVHRDHIHADSVSLYKAWRTKLAGKPFLTWEPKGMIGWLGEGPDTWLVFRVTRENENTLILRMASGEAEPFEGVDKTRRAYEHVLKKHVDDPAIFGEPGDEYRLTLVRADGPVLTFFAKIAKTVIRD